MDGWASALDASMPEDIDEKGLELVDVRLKINVDRLLDCLSKDSAFPPGPAIVKQFNRGRLQLKPGLFWYRHHPKMHEMVSDGSSRAENWADFHNISMCVCFG